MMDDLKALRDEIEREIAMAEPNFPGLAKILRKWAARLTSIIERQEKERAFVAACKIHCTNSDDDTLAATWTAQMQAYRALTEPAKP
jgi:hypothetical protein